MLRMAQENGPVTGGDSLKGFFGSRGRTENTENSTAAAGHPGSQGALRLQKSAGLGNFRPQTLRNGLEYVSD